MRTDRKTFLFILLIILLVIVGESLRQSDHETGSQEAVINPFANLSAKPKIGSQAPAFSLRTPDGVLVSLDQFRGKAVLINFWATWCGPCLIEMPLLQSAAQRHPDDLVVLAINIEEPPRTIKPFLESHHLTFNVLMDEEGKIANTYGIFAYPASFFIDKQGIIRSQQIGQLSESLLVKNLSTIGIDSW